MKEEGQKDQTRKKKKGKHVVRSDSSHKAKKDMAALLPVAYPLARPAAASRVPLIDLISFFE